MTNSARKAVEEGKGTGGRAVGRGPVRDIECGCEGRSGRGQGEGGSGARGGGGGGEGVLRGCSHRYVCGEGRVRH